MEIGYREGEATSYGNLGTVFNCIYENIQAKEYHEKALAINIEIYHREGEARSYRNLGTVFQSLGECIKAKEYHEKALAISVEISNRAEEEAQYGAVFFYLGEYAKAKEYHDKAPAISIETGKRAREMESYRRIGNIFRKLNEMSRLQSIIRKRLRSKSEWEIVEGNTKQTITSAKEIFLILLVNMAMQ